MRTKTASPALVFEKVLRAFETGGFTHADVVAHLKRLLRSGASPTELLEILRREELSEPLPEHARVKVLGLLNDAIARAAAQAPVPDEVKNSDPGTAPDQAPDPIPAPMQSATTAPPVQEAEGPTQATPVALTSVFEKVLNAIETRDFTDGDVLAELQRLLLVTGASPAALLEILRRRKLMEPLSENAHAEVLGLLNDAMGRAGALAESDEALHAKPVTATSQIPDSVSAPTRSTSMAPPLERVQRAAKASVAMTSLRSPDLASTASPNRATTDSIPPTTPIQIATPMPAAHPDSARIPATSPDKAASAAQTVTPGSIPVIGPSRSPAEGPPAAVTLAGLPPPNSVPAKTRTIPPVPAQATTSKSPPASTSIRSPVVEQSVADEEVTIDLDELDHVIEQPILFEEIPERDSVAVGDLLLDRYRLVALIGEGGRSRVFKATDSDAAAPASPDTFIAVKVLTRPINEDYGSFDSFRKEVQRLRRLAHPNIVRIFDCDRDGSIVFITMEYLAGPSLYAKLRGGAAAGKPPSGLGRDEAQYIILAIADALDYAHRSGVVHGDLKPGNVIVLNRGEIKVIDFDMARWVARPETGLARQQSSQQKTSPAVTPSYASPQLMARQAPEPADDVYALACLAYELLTGSHPFEAGARGQSPKFPPPRRAGLSAPEFSAVVHGLQPDRNNRTSTVRQFVAEFSAPEPRAARKPVPIGRVMGVGAALLVLALVAWLFVHRAPEPAPVPVASAPAGPSPGTVIRDCPTCPAMTVLPAGRFKQGAAPAEAGSAFAKPQHWVSIGSSVAMSTNAVTVDEFHEFITATGRDMRGCDTYDGEWKHRPKSNWKTPGFTQAGTHPVTCASWTDAEAYARWLSTETKHRYRLPSASEWEYAARAGSEAVQPWNADGSGACANANLADKSAAHRYPGWTVFGCDDGYVYTAPVGSFKANSFGLNDMLGNVLQWTEDCWHADYDGAPIDGSARTDGNCAERELRGGSWFTTPAYVRADYRNHFAVDYRTSSVGIRLVRDIEP
jgi:formylglycine-generating enzyme required for sulfatase activity/predicted Ser/Thr protein kinase